MKHQSKGEKGKEKKNVKRSIVYTWTMEEAILIGVAAGLLMHSLIGGEAISDVRFDPCKSYSISPFGLLCFRRSQTCPRARRGEAEVRGLTRI